MLYALCICLVSIIIFTLLQVYILVWILLGGLLQHDNRAQISQLIKKCGYDHIAVIADSNHSLYILYLYYLNSD